MKKMSEKNKLCLKTDFYDRTECNKQKERFTRDIVSLWALTRKAAFHPQ